MKKPHYAIIQPREYSPWPNASGRFVAWDRINMKYLASDDSNDWLVWFLKKFRYW